MIQKPLKYNFGLGWLMIIGMLLFISCGVAIILFNIKTQNNYHTKWQKLQAQQASLNALIVAKQMFYKDLLIKDCTNNPKCAFWDGNRNIHLTKNNLPNKFWWHENAYPIKNSPNNAKFIIINKPNNLYKIIAFAEDTYGKTAIISAEYIRTEQNKT